MSKYIICPEDYFETTERHSLEVSELFYDTIQGEGPTAGQPAIFLRLRGCPLNCSWCDTADIIETNGSLIGVHELLRKLIEVENGRLIDDLRRGTLRLVITGGSPLRQQHDLSVFLQKLYLYVGGCTIELENEVIYQPMQVIDEFVSQWNNSPKLHLWELPLKPKQESVIQWMVNHPRAIFKFVITKEEDVEKLKTWIEYHRCPPHKIWVMPEGKTREEIYQKQQMVVDAAIELGVNFSHRLHIILWNDKKGV